MSKKTLKPYPLLKGFRFRVLGLGFVFKRALFCANFASIGSKGRSGVLGGCKIEKKNGVRVLGGS